MTLTDARLLLNNLATEDSGQDLIDYALLAAVIGLAIGAAAKSLDNSVKGDMNSIGNTLTNATA
jgi:pilus assembly protein Flp/PilA